MADDEEACVEGKPLSTLRVVELKQELGKRGLSKAGTKNQLVERLTANNMEDEIPETDESRNGMHKDDPLSGAEDTNIASPESNNGDTQDDDHGIKMASDELSQDTELKDENGKATGRKLSLSNSAEKEKPARKRKWRTAASQSLKKTSLSISTDSLKELIPDIKTVSPLDSLLELGAEEAQLSDTEGKEFQTNKRDVKIRRTVTQVVQEIEPQEPMQDDVELGELPETNTIIVIKPQFINEEPLPSRGEPSPARNPVSHIIHVSNLVRPFTLAQLKELLSRTGTLVEDGFWIDKIKSHCYVTYESEEQAVSTRQSLHGVKWPSPNPKYLKVDYADQDELEFHKNLVDQEVRSPPDHLKKEQRSSEHVNKREWDREHQSSSISKTHGRSRSGSQERRKSEKSKDRREKKDREKKEEEAPAKLLDDLFNKTKATPSVYWLALTEQQIKVREEEAKQRIIDREKRRQHFQQQEKEKKEAERKEARKIAEERRQRKERNDRSKASSHSPARRSRSRNRNSRRH